MIRDGTIAAPSPRSLPEKKTSRDAMSLFFLSSSLLPHSRNETIRICPVFGIVKLNYTNECHIAKTLWNWAQLLLLTPEQTNKLYVANGEEGEDVEHDTYANEWGAADN